MKINQLINESSLSRVWQHTQSNRPFALLTAFRNEHTYDENVVRNKSLAASLKNAGYGYFYVDGYWIENEGTPEEVHVSEDSIFVIGTEGGDDEFLRTIINAGKHWDQDAVLVKANGVIGIYAGGELDFTLQDFAAGNSSEVYTKLRNNKKSNTFIFENTRQAKGFISKFKKRVS